jgi:1,4-alpha-glucan branching enzyme
MKKKQTVNEAVAQTATAKRKTHAPAIPAATAVVSASGKKGPEVRPSTGTGNTPAKGRTASQMQTPFGIKKESTKSGKRKRVTFRLPAQAAPQANKVTIVGEFNDWNHDATPLNKTEDGDFTVTLELDSGKEYRFRYLIDGMRWENDWRADRYVKSPFGVEDSVVTV